jgi:hypothetical protein
MLAGRYLPALVPHAHAGQCCRTSPVLRARSCPLSFPDASHMQHPIYFLNIQIQHLQHKKRKMKHLKHATETLKKHYRHTQHSDKTLATYMRKHMEHPTKHACKIGKKTEKKTLETEPCNICVQQLQHMQHPDLLLEYPYETLATYL